MSSASSNSFNQTRWSLVSRASGQCDHAQRALSELCEIYYQPVYTFILNSHHSRDPATARDLTHDFFSSLLTKNNLGSPNPEQGKFRSYLLGAVKHYLINHYNTSQRQKRGGRIEHLSLNDEDQAINPAYPPPADHEFDRTWALTIIQNALSSLEKELTLKGRKQQYDTYQPWLTTAPGNSQKEAASSLGISETSFKVTLHRMREKFRKYVRSEIQATINDDSDLNQEINYLISTLSLVPQNTPK